MTRFLYCCFVGMWLVSCTPKEYLIYSSGQNGNSDLFLLNLENGESISLTNGQNEEWAPTLTHDSKLTYLCQEGDRFSRKIMDLESNEKDTLSHPSICILNDKNILYSSDGKWELFACNGDIWVNERGMDQPRNLTEKLEGKQFKAVWFPDNLSIAFTSTHTGNQEIFKINLDGNGLENLTNNPHNDEAPDISPDGTLMVFSTNRDGKDNQEIYMMDLESGGTKNITQTPGWELIGRWSLDGKRIYYGSNKTGNWDIYSYDLQTGTHKQLTFSEAFDGDPRPVYLKDRQ